MSQHDLNIANQGFPSFRSDLNGALGALASTSAGTSAPSTTVANQFWYDSTNDLLKMRNSDNDAWITLAYFDQTNDEWQVRSAVIQAVDSAGVSINTDDGTTRFSISDAGQVSFENYSFPTADGTNGQVLTTDGAGNLTFESGGGGDKIEEGNSSVEVVDTGTGHVAVTVDGTETARFDAGGNLKFNSGYGSVATAYGVRAWVHMAQEGTQTIQASGNISSITDLGTGRTRVTFSSAMPDANYAVTEMSEDGGGFNDVRDVNRDSSQTRSTTIFECYGVHSNGSPDDQTRLSLIFVR